MKIPELEQKILGVLWARGGGLKVRDILDSWPEKDQPGYTTVLKKLQVMGEKGLIGHTAEGKAYRYHPLVSRGQVSRWGFSGLLKDLFRGNKIEMASAFFQDASFPGKSWMRQNE